MSGETWSQAAGGPAPAGWGAASWLPARVQRAQYLEEQEERRLAREADRARAVRLERREEEAATAAVAAAELRGEYVDAVDRLSGNVGRHTVQDVLEAARRQGEQEDLVAVARASREPGEVAHVTVAEPVIVASPVKRSILNRHRRWTDWQQKKKVAEDARQAAEHDRDIGLLEGVRLRKRPERDDHAAGVYWA